MRKIAFLFALMSFFMTGYIFSNSMKDSAASHAQSGTVVEFVEPILKPIFGEQDEEETARKMSIIVRKAAHFAEFTLLGFCVGGFAAAITAIYQKRFSGLSLGMCFAVASCDEWIQSFVGRTSSIKDVALDLCGSIFGIMVMLLMVNFLPRKKERALDDVPHDNFDT